ncbi:hypothetical protein Tco_0478189 [Tanacetum coccineum]
MGVFGGVEKVRALGANRVARGSTIGAVWFEVSGGMVSAKVVSMLPTGSFSTSWFGGGESDEEEVRGVRVGRRGLLPLDLIRKTLLLERGIITWSTSWKSLDKGHGCLVRTYLKSLVRSMA